MEENYSGLTLGWIKHQLHVGEKDDSVLNSVFSLIAFPHWPHFDCQSCKLCEVLFTSALKYFSALLFLAPKIAI